MGQRKILCIEPDASQVAEIRSVFASYGYEIESIPNGDQAIEWARTNPPALFILSVEPRKVGYAVCNKIKRSPSLRDIPLVLISSEETEATFEQHKKLKSRADEYLLKPFQAEDLLAKVAPFLSWESSPVDEIQEADSGDIVLADDDLADPGDTDRPVAYESTKGADALALLDDVLESHVPSSGPVASETPFDAEQFDRETQAAFAALEAGAAEGGTPAPTPSPAVSASKPEPDFGNLWSDDIATRLGWDESPSTTASATPGSVPDLAAFLAAPSGGHDAHNDLSGAPQEISHEDFDLAPGTSPSLIGALEDLRTPFPLPSFLLTAEPPSPVEGDIPPALEDVEYPVAQSLDDGRVAELQGEIERLQREKTAREEDRARKNPSWAAGFPRSRASGRPFAATSRSCGSARPTPLSRAAFRRSASSSACARSSTRKRRTFSIYGMRSTPRSARSSIARTRFASTSGPGAI